MNNFQWETCCLHLIIFILLEILFVTIMILNLESWPKKSVWWFWPLTTKIYLIISYLYIIFESKWTFVPNLKKFPRGVLEIFYSQEWDENIMLVAGGDTNLCPNPTKTQVCSSRLNQTRLLFESWDPNQCRTEKCGSGPTSLLILLTMIDFDSGLDRTDSQTSDRRLNSAFAQSSSVLDYLK